MGCDAGCDAGWVAVRNTIAVRPCQFQKLQSFVWPDRVASAAQSATTSPIWGPGSEIQPARLYPGRRRVPRPYSTWCAFLRFAPEVLARNAAVVGRRRNRRDAGPEKSALNSRNQHKRIQAEGSDRELPGNRWPATVQRSR